MAESRTSVGEPESASLHAPAAFDNERVREFEPPAAVVTEPVAPGPGFAIAAPVKIEWPAGLEQVESDPDKVRAADREMVQEQPMPRPKRVRSPQAPVIEEPLVQIETGQPESAAPEQTTPTLPA